MHTISLFLLMILTPPHQTHLRMGKVLQEIDHLEDRFLERPTMAQLYRDEVVLFDDKSQLFWWFGVGGDIRLILGGQGEAPGQITPFVSSWFVVNDQLTVIHASGFREEVFAKNGKLKASRKLALKGSALFPLPDGHWIVSTQPSNDVARLDEAGELTPLGIVPKAQSQDVNGFCVANNDDAILVATSGGTTNTVFWGLISLQGQVRHKGAFHTIPTSSKENFPSLPPGAQFFPITVGAISAGTDGNFYLTESGIDPMKHPSYGQTTVVRTINREGEQAITYLYSREASFAQAFPLDKGVWFCIAPAEGKVIIFEADSVD